VKEKIIWAGIGVLLGLVFAPQLSKLPLVNKIPTV
jgi:hypothetical protein